VGITGETLVRPHTFQHRLTGTVYHDGFTQHSFTATKDVQLQTKACVSLMRDSVATHFSIADRIFLNDTYPERNGCTALLSKSPHFISLALYLWRHIKITVNATSDNGEAGVQERVKDGCCLIAKTP
jgi:hypothetical protein